MRFTIISYDACNACILAQIAVAGAIIKGSGVGALYKGLSASLLRQATYTTARMGIFNNISESLRERNGGAVGSWGYQLGSFS